MQNRGGQSSNVGGRRVNVGSETRREQGPASPPSRIYSCSYCSKVFFSSQAFAGHHNLHKDEERIRNHSVRMNVPIYVTPISVRPPLHEPFVPGSLFGATQGTATWFQHGSGSGSNVVFPGMYPTDTADMRSFFEVGSGSGQVTVGRENMVVPPPDLNQNQYFERMGPQENEDQVRVPVFDVWNIEDNPADSEKTVTCPEVRNLAAEGGNEVTSRELDLSLKL